MRVEYRGLYAAPNGNAQYSEPIDRLSQAVPPGLDGVRGPEQSNDLVARHISTSLRAKVQREPELQFGLWRQPDATRVDLSLAEYAAADCR